MKRKLLLGSLIALPVLVVGLYLFNAFNPLPENPPLRHSGALLSGDGDEVLRRACFDCHSNETRYPWYSWLPGIGGLIGHHVREGREELNFSLWDQMRPSKRRKAVAESLEAVREGEMPQLGYTLLNPEAKLSGQDVAVLEQSAAQAYGKGILKESRESGHDGERRKSRRRHDDDDDDDDD